MSNIKTGDTVPSVEFKTIGESGIETLTSASLFEGCKVLLIGVMGAFTPVCSKKHLPDFIPFASELKKNGIVDKLMCISVADPFVLKAWKDIVDPDDKVLMLTDGNAEFAKAMGLDLDLSHLGLGIRSTRYAMLIENNIVNMLNIEKEPQHLDVTNSKAIAKFFGV
ncbi:MAG: peroxiredoxin [Phenylobacterium sp.]|jgi:peroxiredoxin